MFPLVVRVMPFRHAIISGHQVLLSAVLPLTKVLYSLMLMLASNP